MQHVQENCDPQPTLIKRHEYMHWLIPSTRAQSFNVSELPRAPPRPHGDNLTYNNSNLNNCDSSLYGDNAQKHAN